MGMSASQARLLTLTSRLSDLELQAQQIGNAKIRLSQKTAEAAADYNKALTKQVLQVETGPGKYIEATARNLTTFGAVSDTDPQRFLKNSSGQVLVAANVKTAYDTSGPDLNKFLLAMGCTKTQLNKQSTSTTMVNLKNIIQKIENDKAFTLPMDANDNPNGSGLTYTGDIKSSDGKTGILPDLETLKTDLTAVKASTSDAGSANIDKFIGYINILEGHINAHNNVDYRDQAILQALMTGVIPATYACNNYDGGMNGSNNTPLDTSVNAASLLSSSSSNDPKVTFYTNVFQQIQANGSYTISDEQMNSNEWLTSQLTSGALTLVESTDPAGTGNKSWNEVSWSSGDADLRQSTDDTQQARAEAEYDHETAEIQVKDKTFDLQLANVNTEHSAVQTEIDTVKGVIDKNIQRSFKLFQA